MLVGFIAVDLLGSLSGLPQCGLDLEPFAHILRAGSVVSALVAVVAAGNHAALEALGVTAFGRRDLRC